MADYLLVMALLASRYPMQYYPIAMIHREAKEESARHLIAVIYILVLPLGGILWSVIPSRMGSTLERRAPADG
jgi:hypothetical protein